MLRKGTVLIIILFFVTSTMVSATNYFVSSTRGSDSNNGLTSEFPWKSIGKVNGKKFLPGDSILFRKGDVWRETLILPSSGSVDKYIVYSSYGAGSLPKILGSDEITHWDNQTNNIWKSRNTVSDPEAGNYPGTLYYKKPDGNVSWANMQKAKIGELAIEYDWVYSANYIYIFSPADPNSRYDGVEVAQRQYGIQFNNKEYITIDGFEIQFFCRAGTGESYPTADRSGLIIKNCRISYMGIRDGAGSGIFASHSDMLIQNNIIHDAGRRNIDLNTYGLYFTIKNIIVENNTLYNGFHTTGIDMSASGIANSFNNITFRSNHIYDNPYADLTAPAGYYYHSCGIFVQNYGKGGTTINNVYIYNNILRNSQSELVALENIQSAFIYNNTFYGSHQTVTDNVFMIKFTYGCTNIIVKNNIFYGNTNYDVIRTAPLIDVASNSDETEIEADYNLYYQVDNRTPIVSAGNNNYHIHDWAAMKTRLGWETHSPAPADPGFVSASDYHIQSGSPAIGSGIAIEFIKTDYGGKYFNDPPSIGAYEGNPRNSPAPNNKVIILFPNSSQKYINILREGQSLNHQIIKIFNLSRKIVFSDSIEFGTRNVQFPVNLNPGVYIVQVLSDKITIVEQKIIVVN